MRGEAGRLAATLWAARPPAELMETVAQLEGLRATLDGLELTVVAELEATGAVKSAGWASTQDFLTHTAGAHRGAGSAMVRLARATADPVLAPVGDALTAGWLSAVKAHVIVRAVDTLPGDPDVRTRAVELLLREAARLDATELGVATRHLTSLVDPEGDARREERALEREDRVAHSRRHLSVRDDHAGGAWITGRCSSEDAALIRTTLIPLATPLPLQAPEAPEGDKPGSRDQRDPRDHGARMLDALVQACRLLQTTEVLPTAHGAVPRVSVVIDYRHLREALTRTAAASSDDDPRFADARTETGERLTPATARRLACDADLIPALLGSRSEVLDVGRSQRLVTPAIWKALVLRDTHCRFPHCTRPPIMCHAHHIRHWADGGPTSLGNLILLCGHHHRLIHAGPWQVHPTGTSTFEFRPRRAGQHHPTTHLPEPDG